MALFCEHGEHAQSYLGFEQNLRLKNEAVKSEVP